MGIKVKLLLILLLCSCNLFAQTNVRMLDSTYKAVINNIELKLREYLKNPDNWDKALELLESRLTKKDSSAGKWLNDLNLDFKTFQNEDSTKASLGFSYDLNIERAKIRDKGTLRNGRSFSLESKGNIAFKKEVNPNDFLNTKLALNFFHTGGGVVHTDTSKGLLYLAGLRRQMAVTYNSAEEILNSPEWREFNNAFTMKNSWIVKSDVNAGIESNQDFTRKQYTAGVRLGAGVKSWNRENVLSKLNILDYPFELIRKITNYDGNIHPGITIPNLLVGFDYVNPVKDTARERIKGDLDAFPRLSLELGFRTPVTEVSSQTLFFNSSFKYFRELGAEESIRNSKLNRFSYFTMSITSTSGFYVSYTVGKLPLDRQDDGVYELGFRYKFD